MAEICQSRTVTINQLHKSLMKCIAMKRPVMITGSPGIGKSDLIEQISDSMGGILYDVRLSQCDPTDVRGIPFYNKESGKMEWADPVDLPDAAVCAKYPISFLFLDEITSAPQTVAAASFQLVLNRRVGTYFLPDNCVIIAAGNKESDRGVVYKMPTPLANRFVHFELRVDFDSWNEWAIEKRIHSDVIGFLNFSQDSLDAFDPKSSEKAQATPRTWEFVSQLLDNDMEDSIMTDIIAGSVGEGMALKFQAQRKYFEHLPTPEEVLSGLVTTMQISEISAFYALATSLCYKLSDDWEKMKGKDENSWYMRAGNFLKFVMENFTTELTVFSMRIAIKNYKLPFHPEKVTSFKEFRERFGKYLVMAAQV